jgi:hypothetical protein
MGLGSPVFGISVTSAPAQNARDDDAYVLVGPGLGLGLGVRVRKASSGIKQWFVVLACRDVISYTAPVLGLWLIGPVYPQCREVTNPKLQRLTFSLEIRVTVAARGVWSRSVGAAAERGRLA